MQLRPSAAPEISPHAAADRSRPAGANILGRHPGVALFLLAIIHVVFAVARSREKPLWFDELFTYYVSARSSIPDIISALAMGFEPHPPLTYILGHASMSVFGDSATALRLPQILAFMGMEVCLYFIVSRRCSGAATVIAMLVPYISGGWSYAYEARPYAIVLFFAALAYLAWQHATELTGRRLLWLAVLACAVAGAMNTQYHAIFLPFALGVGELASSIRKRRIDWPVYAALAAGYLPLIYLYPLIRAIRVNVAQNALDRPYWLSYVWAYEHLFSPMLLYVIASLIIACVAALPARREAGEPRGSGLTMPEAVAATALALLPFFVLVLAMAMPSQYYPRYSISTIIGVALLVAFHMDRTHRRTAIALALCLTFGFALTEFRVPRRVFFRGAAPEADLFPVSLAGDLPIVAQDPRIFLQLYYYAPPDVKNRMWYLVHPDESLRRFGTNILERGMMGIRRIVPIRVENYQSFVQKNPTFLLYWDAAPREGVLTGLVLPRLSEDGAVITVERQNGARILYRVSTRQ